MWEEGIDIGFYNFTFTVYNDDTENLDYQVHNGTVKIMSEEDEPTLDIHDAMTTEDLWEVNFEIEDMIEQFVKALA